MNGHHALAHREMETVGITTGRSGREADRRLIRLLDAALKLVNLQLAGLLADANDADAEDL
jgi:hypothetical protein